MRRDAATAAMLPLQDRQIVVTRAEESGSGLAELLRERGARVIEIPLIRILPPHDPAPLHAAVARLSRYDWVVFTSASAVRALHAALPRGRAPIRPRRIAAVGPATARVIIEELGWAVDAMPESFAGSQVAAAMAATAPLAGASICWPRAADARPGLREALDAVGARLDAPEAYRTEAVPAAAAELARLVSAGSVHVITFTSPSAVRCYAGAGASTGGACVAVMGPTTAAAARAAGFPVHVVPQEHTFPALVEQLIRHLNGVPGEAGAT